jgi:hypothetical protein
MNTETVGFETARGQKFVPGIQGFSNAAIPLQQDPNAISPNAIRWMFNPFAYINVSERPTTGHQHLGAGVFIPITSQPHNVALPNQPALTPQARYAISDDMSKQWSGLSSESAPPPGYRQEIRSAYAISNELEDAYSDKGLRVLPSLTKFDNMAGVAAIHQTFVADGLTYSDDPYQPNFPVPNLVKLEEYLVKVATPNAQKVASDLEVSPTAVISDILVAVRTALQTCRNVTRDAKRVVANKTVGYVHAFDAWQSRCFLALGEKVPSDLPFISESGHMAAPGTLPVSNNEVDRLRAENEQLRREALERENATLREQVAKMQATAQPDVEAVIEKIDCSFIKKDGNQCKGRGNPETGRCPAHPLENEQKENEENAEERSN